jgi:uncharacterized membrane protein
VEQVRTSKGQQMRQPDAGATARGVPGLFRSPDLAALTVIALAGLAISAYLTSVHYAGTPLLCSAGGVVNCAAVTSSIYSFVPGTQIPITIPGMIWFLVSGALTLAGWNRQRYGQPGVVRVTLLHLGWSALGLLAVLYLVYAEIVRLHEICEWCTAVHILTLLTFLLVLSRLQRLPEEDVTTVPARSGRR